MSTLAPPVGQFFTPLEWARVLISRGAFTRWLEGARVLDPTGGDGALLEAFVSKAMQRGINPTEAMLSRLCMMEIDGSLVERFHARMWDSYRLSVPEANTRVGDYLLEGYRGRFEVIVGNPPWVNFTELPQEYKEQLKPAFERYRLVLDRRKLLWGGARIDLAALVVAKAFADNATEAAGRDRTGAQRSTPDRIIAGGSDTGAAASGTVGAFFLPISLFFNDGAHEGFRTLAGGAGGFTVARIHDLTDAAVFAGVRTRYAMVDFGAPDRHAESVPYLRTTRDGAIEHSDVRMPAGDGESAGRSSGVWESKSVWLVGESPRVEPITIPERSRPRQGVNTCGANDLFMFDADDVPPVEPGLLYPLIGRSLFEPASGNGDEPVTRGDEASTNRLVLLPYDRRSGRPLDEATLRSRYPRAWEYLCAHRERLSNRRGTIIRGAIRRGAWWALVGVGPYTFARWKIVWPASGARRFTPRLFEGRWVANQALQISMSFDSRDDAKRVLRRLTAGDVERVLLAGGEAGTRGWAQPGRMRRFFRIADR